MSVSPSGSGTFIKKIKGMDQVAQKWEGPQAPPPVPPPMSMCLGQTYDCTAPTNMIFFLRQSSIIYACLCDLNVGSGF